MISPRLLRLVEKYMDQVIEEESNNFAAATVSYVGIIDWFLSRVYYYVIIRYTINFVTSWALSDHFEYASTLVKLLIFNCVFWTLASFTKSIMIYVLEEWLIRVDEIDVKYEYEAVKSPGEVG